MTLGSRQIFRPSGAQRALTALLCAGSWLVGARSLILLVQGYPQLLGRLRWAEATHEGVAWAWTLLVGSVVACLVAGILLAVALLVLLLQEGSQVAVDEMGISMECATLPQFLARRLGAGRLGWKEVGRLGKQGFFFTIRPVPPDPDQKGLGPRPPVLRFLLVEDLERLLHVIMEHSPNLRWQGDD